MKDEFFQKTLTVSTRIGSETSENINKIFHYLEEEKIIINKSERSCYWISDLQNLSYFNKSIVDKYHYIECDISCRTCEFDAKMCIICMMDFIVY